MLMKAVKRALRIEDDHLASQVSRLLGPALAIYAVCLIAQASTKDVRLVRFLDNVHWTTSYGFAALLAWLGVRSACPEEIAPKRWFAWALSAYAFGQVLWDVQVATGWNPFPGPSDLFYVVLGPFTGVGLLLILLRRAEPTERRSALLDSAGLSFAVLALTLALYLPRRGELALLQISFLVAYPVVLCWAACGALTVVLALRLRLSRGLILFLGALLGNAALWLEWNSLTLDNALADGTLHNALFSLCALAQGTGALLFRADATRAGLWERLCEAASRLLPLLMVIVCGVAVVLAFTLSGVPSSVRKSAVLGGLVVAVIATLRQSLVLGARERLITTERALRRSEESYRVLIEQAADGIFIADRDGVYRDVNSRGAEMVGMTRSELIGKRIVDILPPEQHARVAPELAELARGAVTHSSWTILRKDGSTFPAEVTAKMSSDGRVQAFIRDVSERLALEAQLRQSQKMEAIGVLAAGIAHDFNNILSAIRGNAALAAEDVAPEHPAAESIADIERAAQRATELVQRILAFSRPGSVAREAVRLDTVVREVCGLLRPTLPAGVELVARAAERPLVVSADPGQLHQILMNLCTNAWQALDGKAGTITITLSQHEGDEPGLELGLGSYACVSVSDTGRGMAPATLERIFEPFFTTREPGRGTGLGLSVVHSIVASHRGTVRIESRLGAGSTFHIYLPALETTDEVGTESRHERASGGRKVLDCSVAYVDDEAPIVSVMVKKLERLGYRVQGFTSGTEALEALRSNPSAFDVLVTDHNMPKMSGLQLTQAARAVDANLPVVLTSGYVSDELALEAKTLGIVRIVQKPEAVDDLCSAIEEARKATRRSQQASA